MVSERDNRQRAAARARLEREMAARQEAARRKRLLQARIGAGVAAWSCSAPWSGSSSRPPAAIRRAGRGGPHRARPRATWVTTRRATADPAPRRPVARRRCPRASRTSALPPTEVPRSGYQVLTFDTNLGVIKVEMDLSKTPCTAASMAYLASKGFYDNTSCHRLVAGIFALQCGDPSRHRLRRRHLPLRRREPAHRTSCPPTTPATWPWPTPVSPAPTAASSSSSRTTASCRATTASGARSSRASTSSRRSPPAATTVPSREPGRRRPPEACRSPSPR